MLKNMSLTFKLSLMPAVAVIGLLVFVGYTSMQLSKNDARLVALENNSYPILEKTDSVIFQFSRLPGMFNSAVTSGEIETLNEVRKILDVITIKEQELQDLNRGQAQRNQELMIWKDAINRYSENAISASEQLIKGSGTFDSLRPNLDRMAIDLDAANKLGADFRISAYKAFQANLSQTRTDNDTTTRVGYGLSLVLVLLVAVGSIMVIHRVMKNIHGVVGSLQAIASGDGDLTRRVNVSSGDEIGTMIILFNSLLDKLQGTIRQVIDSANPLGDVSKELYCLTQDSEKNTKSQQGRTDSISRDIHTMSLAIQEVAQRSQQASQEAGSASKQADTARQNIIELSSNISDLGVSVLNAVQDMQQLEEETRQVGTVLTVIRSIAEQTNLLALNAAIEAARAGDQGRGFAVVADEVRALAQKTSVSTAKIQEIIQRLQSSANNVLGIMTLNGEKAQASIASSVQATETLDVIAQTVRQIDQLNAGIAQFTYEQIGLSHSIQKDTEVLQQGSKASAHGADATARLGERLVSTGDHLRATTSQFRV